MGSVYLARDPDTDRLVAVKLLRDGFDDDELRARFSTEARSASALRHTNIVTIFQTGTFLGRPFIVMEYIQGETFAELAAKAASIPLARKLQWMDELSAGLQYAHAKGIVHRDIKPANVMVDDEGVVRILDFGIARLGQGGLTRTGAVIGTLNYMAPEQLAGRGVDARADIFAAGLVFYELLSSQPAFPQQFPEVLRHIGYEDPPALETLCPGLEPALIDIVARCTRKEPEERYPDFAAVRRDLAAARRRIADAPLDVTAGLPSADVAPTFRPPSSEQTIRRGDSAPAVPALTPPPVAAPLAASPATAPPVAAPIAAPPVTAPPVAAPLAASSPAAAAETPPPEHPRVPASSSAPARRGGMPRAAIAVAAAVVLAGGLGAWWFTRTPSSTPAPQVIEPSVPTPPPAGAPPAAAARAPVAQPEGVQTGIAAEPPLASAAPVAAPAPRERPAAAREGRAGRGPSPVRVGGPIKPPIKVKNVDPVYPDMARSARLQGVVILEATIGTTGKVTDVRVLRSIPLLDVAAMDAVRQWEYQPTMVNGVATPVITTVTVRFALTPPPVRVGGEVKPPVLVKRVSPTYPPEALAARTQGIVILEATIDVNGKVSDVRVLRSIALLDQAAVDAVKQFEYMPTILNGVATPVITTVSVQFTLTTPAAPNPSTAPAPAAPPSSPVPGR